MLPNLGGPEILIVLVVLVLLFGAGRMSGIARSVGSGIREFRNVGRFDVTDEKDTEEEREPAALVAARGEDDETVRETR